MLIAQCSVKGLTVPVAVYDLALYQGEIDVYGHELPHGADKWITCFSATPHIDPDWADMIFLTLTVEGVGHELGDSTAVARAAPTPMVPPGSVFIVDPVVPHWLIDNDAAQGNRSPDRWVGLQWELPRKNARHAVRRICKELQAKALYCDDKRYWKWL